MMRFPSPARYVGVTAFMLFLSALPENTPALPWAPRLPIASIGIRRYFGLVDSQVCVHRPGCVGSAYTPQESGQLLSNIIILLSSGLSGEMVGPARAKASIKLSGMFRERRVLGSLLWERLSPKAAASGPLSVKAEDAEQPNQAINGRR